VSHIVTVEIVPDEWLRGYAAALAAVQRLHHQSSIVVSVMLADGLSLAIFRKAGVEPFDMSQLEKAVPRSTTPP